MSLELLMQGPSVTIPIILVSILFTLVTYASFPLIFAAVRKKNITVKKYNTICYVVNFAISFLELTIILLNNSSNSKYHYNFLTCLIWTPIFIGIGKKILKTRCVLDGYQETNGEQYECENHFCPNCGSEISDEDDEFCSICGSKIKKG